MLNIGQMMKQVQEMQAKMGQMQERLADTVVEGQSGGGMVTATMNGKGDLKKIKLDSKLIDPAEVEMLEDLIVAAVGDAKAKMDGMVAGETEKMMGGLKLPPGMKLPF
ncbi:MAG: YbaB/EbfC family nucleoid-associated protein [Alphaproteobacteria bacterium]|nr:YbaB/EbfC family nucleoid-associated protein [Alphaproteobacteria bacterium]